MLQFECLSLSLSFFFSVWWERSFWVYGYAEMPHPEIGAHAELSGINRNCVTNECYIRWIWIFNSEHFPRMAAMMENTCLMRVYSMFYFLHSSCVFENRHRDMSVKFHFCSARNFWFVFSHNFVPSLFQFLFLSISPSLWYFCRFTIF